MAKQDEYYYCEACGQTWSGDVWSQTIAAHELNRHGGAQTVWPASDAVIARREG